MSAGRTPCLAAPGDWDAHRAIITDLYQSQGKTLKEVSAIMQSEHGFLGTPKTYKTHFEKWGLQKNFRSKQVAEILHQKNSRDAAGKATKILVRGKEVPGKRLDTYIRRTTKKPQILNIATELEVHGVSGANHDMMPMVLCRTPSPVPSSSPQMAFVASNWTPGWDEYMQQESMSFFGLDSSPQITFSSTPIIPELWEPFQNLLPISDEQDLSESSTSVDAFNHSQPDRSALSCRKQSAAPAISHFFSLAMPEVLGRPEECIYLIRDYVSERFGSGSWKSHSILDDCKQDVEWHNLADSARFLLDKGHYRQAFRMLDRCFSRYRALLPTPSSHLFVNTCLLIVDLSINFPDLAMTFLRRALDTSQLSFKNHHPLGKLLHKMCLMNIMELRQSLRSLLDCYSQYFENKIDPESDFIIEILAVRCEIDWTLEGGGLLDTSVAEAHIKSLLRAVEQYGNLARADVLRSKYYLAELYFQNDRFDEASSIISGILASADPNDDLAIMDDCYCLLYWISYKMCSHDEIVSSMNQWKSFTKAHFGQGDRYIDVLAEWEEYLREIKDVDLADKTFWEIDTAVEELCVDFDEFLDLSVDEDDSS